AIAVAMSENPTVKVADLEITKKEYATKTAYGALLPQIDAIGQYQRTLKRQTMYLDGGFGFGPENVDISEYTPEELQILKVLGDLMGGETDTSEGIQMGRLNSWTAGVNVNLPLVVPSLWRNIQISKVDTDLAMEQARSSKIELANQVKKAYFSLLLAHDSYTVFRETYTTDSVNLEDIKRKFNQGLVAEYDVITADVRLQSIIPNMLQAENMQKIAELQLKMLMGIDGDVPFRILGSLSDYEETMFEEVLMAQTSLMQNTELKQFDLQQSMAEQAVEIQKLQYLPTLTSSFSYMYMSQNNDFKFRDYKWDPYSFVNITLAIPIYNGGQRRYNVRQSEIQLEQMKYQRVNLERSLDIAVRNHIDLINKNIEQIVATQSSVEQAKRGYMISQKRYETGLGTIVEVNAAALAVTSAELQYRNAIYDYLAAKADLEKTMGHVY
ncbi:MAG: TolC family protein, partial [Bacteroidia bacterium]|nr:TolC family protein [Bacteroidia bacterium]